MRRTAREIIKDIIIVLKDKPLSLRSMERIVNADNRMIKKYVGILEELKIVKLSRKGKYNALHAELTRFGRRLY